MTPGEGTGQVNINPDKSTMADWNFDRIMDTKHSIQQIPQEWSGRTEICRPNTLKDIDNEC